MTCTNARDSITQDAGRVLSNHYDYSDSEHIVTSHCRTSDGTWITWKNLIFGDTIADTGLPDNDPDKSDWPSRIASANAVGVGFFPDDESAPVVYELGIDPVYTWDTHTSGTRDPCSLWGFTGDHYADNPQSRLVNWSMDLIDVQVRTDGTSVWVVALAREAVKNPFLYNSPSEIDRCGHFHPTLESYWAGGHSDAFFHDSDAGNAWWYYRAGLIGGDMPFGAYDYPGPDLSFRWQPARVTVWAGDIGGFTRLDTIEAAFDNASVSAGLCSGIEVAASAAEPGVLHLLWAEGGEFGVQTVEPKRGQRINYSRWDFTGKLLDTDLSYAEEDGSGYVSDANWVWTGEMILRNDHGSPIAIVWPSTTDGVSRFASAAAEFWDLSGGTIVVLQVADIALAPTAGEGNDGGGTPQSVFGWQSNASLQIGSLGFDNIRRSQYASSLYTDPTLDNRDVYLLCVGYGQGVERAGCQAFLRVPCDGSAAFDYMDGTRSVGYSIIPGNQFVDVFGGSEFRADFVSDPDNVWMPAAILGGGGVMHLYRRCIPAWELVPAFPVPDPSTGYEDGDWAGENNVTPPTIVTDSGGDWLAGAGTGPKLTVLSGDPTNIAALRAKICRCCIPCQPLGVRLWKRV